MDLGSIIVSHWKLRNPSQVPGMATAILEGELLPPLVLCEVKQDLFQILDGHHRCAAYWLAGCRNLDWGDFNLLAGSYGCRPMRGSLEALVMREFPHFRDRSNCP